MAGRVPHCRPRHPAAGQLPQAARVAQGSGLGQRVQPGPLLASCRAAGHNNHFTDYNYYYRSQVTLYVPGLVLRPGNNTVLLMEQVWLLCSLHFIFQRSSLSMFAGPLSLSLIQGPLHSRVRNGASNRRGYSKGKNQTRLIQNVFFS